MDLVLTMKERMFYLHNERKREKKRGRGGGKNRTCFISHRLESLRIDCMAQYKAEINFTNFIII